MIDVPCEPCKVAHPLLMNRINPALFSLCFTAWVRETWPGRPDFGTIDGKTSRRSHDRKTDKAAIHVVSAFATTVGDQQIVGSGRQNVRLSIQSMAS